MAPDRSEPTWSLPVLLLAVLALSLSGTPASARQSDNISSDQACTGLAQKQNQLAQNDPYNPPILRGLDQNNSASVTEPEQPVQSSLPQTSPVGSFFQVPAATRPDAAPKAKPHSGAYKFVWHVMDNAGVPMFGNKDPDIDPSLSRPFIMPPLTPDIPKAPDDTSANAGAKPVKPTIIDPDAAAQDPSQLIPDDTTSKASSNSKPSPNPQ